MSEISEKAIKLIKDLRRDISIDIMFTPEKNAEDDSLKALMEYIAELEAKAEVQESEATSCKFCGSNKSDIRMNSIVCTSCGRKIGNIAPPERIAELEAAQRWIPVSEPPKECEMRVFKDGDAWCFVLPDFQDLQVSPSVWKKKGVLDKIYKAKESAE